jgi:hypothetical protein
MDIPEIFPKFFFRNSSGKNIQRKKIFKENFHAHPVTNSQPGKFRPASGCPVRG